MNKNLIIFNFPKFNSLITRKNSTDVIKFSKFNDKLLTILCNFAPPSESVVQKDRGIKHIIASTIFRPYPIFAYFSNSHMPAFGYDFNKIIPKLINAQLFNIVLIDVFPNDIQFDAGFIELDTDYYKKTLSLDKNITFYRLNMTYQDYFHTEYLEGFLKLSLGTDVFYQFHGTNWPLLLSEFKLLNYTLSGGSTTKRHILTPTQDKLSQFLGCIDEKRKITVADSFHFDKESSTKMTHTLIDFKSKDTGLLKTLEEERRKRVIQIEDKKNHYQIKESFTPLSDGDDLLNKIKPNCIVESRSPWLHFINYLHFKHSGEILIKERGIIRHRKYGFKYNEKSNTEGFYKKALNWFKREYSTNTDNWQNKSFKNKTKTILSDRPKVPNFKINKKINPHSLNLIKSRSSISIKNLNFLSTFLNVKSINKIITRNYSNFNIDKPNKTLFNLFVNYFSTIKSNLKKYTMNSPIYKVLTTTLTLKNFNEETQLIIEKYLKNQYIEQLLEKEKIEKEKDVNINYNKLKTPLLNELIKHKDILFKLIKNYKKELTSTKPIREGEKLKREIFLNTKNDFLLKIIFGRLFRIISNHDRFNKNTNALDVYLDLGKELTNQYLLYLYNLFKKENNLTKLSFSLWKKDNSDLILKLNDQTLIINLGSLLVSWLKELKLIESKKLIISKKEKHNIFIVGSSLEQFLPKDNIPLLHLPNKIPMIVKPKQYKKLENEDTEILGGYLLNDQEYTDPLIKDYWSLICQTKILDKNIIYDMVNNISSVPYKINGKVLDFILNNYKKYDLLIDPDFVHPLTIESLEKKLGKRKSTELESFLSIKELEQNIIGLATIFRDVPNIYFPVRLDYRGRINVITEYLTYQGSELAKALLIFSNGEKVDKSDILSINYLKIFGANCFGNNLDKDSFENRIKWVDNNLESIKNFKNGILLYKAENKLLFIAFCFEFNNYLNSLNDDLPYFITHLPIQMDASCNGFQHLTLLIGDLGLSEELNLSESNWSDKPKDFYTFIALKMKHYFEKELTKNNLSEEEKESYLKIAISNIHRKIIKKPLMVIPYNAKPYSIVNYIKEEFIFESKDKYILKDDPNVIFTEFDFQAIRKALNIVLFRDYPKLSVLLDYLKEIAKISNELKTPIPWILPSGLIVKQQFYATKGLKIKPFRYSKETTSVNIPNKDNFNLKKQLTAFMPNLVHSLDAASLTLLIDNYYKEKTKCIKDIENNNNFFNFYSIHDCFAVTCNNVSKINNILKAVYCSIYSEDKYLLKLDKYFFNYLINIYGSDSYDPQNRTFSIQTINKTIEIKYPDINKTININTLNFESSSYLIH